MPTYDFELLAYGATNSTSLGVGHSTAVAFVEAPADLDNTFIVPTLGQSINGPDVWYGTTIGMLNGTLQDVHLRAISDIVFTTNAFESIPIPTGAQVGDEFYLLLSGYGDFSDTPWTFTGTGLSTPFPFNFSSDNGNMYHFIYRWTYDGSVPLFGADVVDESKGWSIQTVAVYTTGTIYNNGFNYVFDPATGVVDGSNIYAYGSAAIYFVGSSDNNVLMPAKTTSLSIYLPGEIAGTIDTSKGIYMEGLLNDPLTILTDHRVVAEFGNNSQNDDQVVTASSVKVSPRGFHHFETTTDSYNNPPSNGGTTPSRPAAPTLVGYTFADTIYPGYDGSMVNSELTFELPTGAASGDLLICVIATDDFSYTIDDAAWTYVDNLNTDELNWWWARYEDLTGPITFYDHVSELGASGTGVLFAVRGWDTTLPGLSQLPFGYTANIGDRINNDTAFTAPVECLYMRQGGLFLEVGMDTEPDDGTGYVGLLRYKSGNSPVKHLDNHRISRTLVTSPGGIEEDSGPDHVSIGIASARPFSMPDIILLPNGSTFGRETPYTGYWEIIPETNGSGTPYINAGRGSVGIYIPPPSATGVNGDFLFEEYFPSGWEENWTYTETNGSDVHNLPDGFVGYIGEISLGPTATQQSATETNVLIPSNFDMVVPWWNLDSAGGFIPSTDLTTGNQSIVVSFRSTQEHSSQTLANCYAVYVNFRLKQINIYKVNAAGAHVLLGTGTASGMVTSPGTWPYAVGIQANGSTIRAKVGFLTEGPVFSDTWDVQVTDSTYPGNPSGNYFKVAYMDGIPSSTGSGGTGGGGGGSGGGPPGGNGTANLRQMFLDRYAHPATTIAVTNDAEVADAIVSISSAGGIIEMATGTYGPVSFVDVNPSQYILLMPASGATVHIDAAGQADAEGLERGILLRNSSYVGAYGLEISSINASGHPYADVVGASNSHHIAIWNCNIHDGASGVGGVECNHYDICYNRVHHTSGWLDTFGSGISLYKLINIGGGVDADGYDNRIIGNLSYANENDPSYGSAITDGNGIIIDIANGDYATNLVAYTGRVLVLNNICVDNGGRGVHSLFSRNTDIMFNTSAYNEQSTAIQGQSEIDTIGSENCIVRGNIMLPDTPNGWFSLYEVSTTPVDNVILGGAASFSTANNFDHTAQGSNYFGTPDTTMSNVASWRPITSDEVIIDSALYSRIGGWPDALQNYRTDTTWSAGAIEVFANVVTTPDTPTAPFFYPEDYGALGNGVADDTAALQACMDAVLANGSGSMILNSVKTYCHSGVLFCDGIPMYGGGSRSGNDIVGGATLWGTNDSTSNVWIRDGGSAFGIIFRNDATTRGANYEHNKVTIRGSNITVKNCAVHGAYAAGFMASAAFNCTVENVCVLNTNSDSMHNTDACDNITYTDCYVENSGDDCFATIGYGGQGPNTNITWIRPVCRGGRARAGSVSGGSYVHFQDVDFEGTEYAGIYIANETVSYDTEPTDHVTVQGGKVTNCATGNNGHPSILFFQDTGGSVTTSSVTDLDIYNQGGTGAYFIEGRGGPSSCSVTNIRVFSTPRTGLVAGGITATNVVYG